MQGYSKGQGDGKGGGCGGEGVGGGGGGGGAAGRGRSGGAARPIGAAERGTGQALPMGPPPATPGSKEAKKPRESRKHHWPFGFR
jgi:hypothetical protein